MEVAGQWRREWAGTAEYGKVTEGGVTRRVARAMEVLHASAPGARVRVLRAAYHATSGPGAPASSYLLHSSRRVISSGYNFIEPETSPSNPLEISSTPLESSPELEVEKENYEVTEPDDFEISEPSKWRGSRSINSIRMPSEESSSTDNASIIDLDNHVRNTTRKSTERFTPQISCKNSSPITSLLDAPVSLSTLKYKTLLNGSDSWNNRRKSYSFEETPELEESILRGTEALTMESSTDSGICKSTEIVNDNYNLDRYVEKKSKMDDIHEENFKEWLSKDRKKHNVNKIKSINEYVINVERNDEAEGSNITLQSPGKVLITLPTPNKTDEFYETNKIRVADDSDRRTKKVEFCKTELHFAADSGTVNIIATDEKPPPTNDFRKKRSAFVPLTDNYNKSITLFREKTDSFETIKKDNSAFISEINTMDENTAATKSILKNKIPKPKPYLLGENMVFGDSNELKADDDINIFSKPTAVSLINRQLQPERRFSNDSRSSIESETDWSSFQNSTVKTTKIGLMNHMRANQKLQSENSQIEVSTREENVKGKIKHLQNMSPTAARAKTRKLRESDLTYFGVPNATETSNEKRKHSLDSIYDEKHLTEEILHSVKLVKSVTNSVCNSEADSDEAPDYENLPMKYNFAPKPAPRSRSKYDNYVEGRKDQVNLNPILEKDDESIIVEPRRARLKKQVLTQASRSLSEPPKPNRPKSVITSASEVTKTNHMKNLSTSKDNTCKVEKSQKNKFSDLKEKRKSESPVYINLRIKETKKVEENYPKRNNLTSSREKQPGRTSPKVASSHRKHTNSSNSITREDFHKSKDSKKRSDSEKQKRDGQNVEMKKSSVQRTKILITPENSPSKSSEASTNRHRNSDRSSCGEKTVNKTYAKDHISLKNNSRGIKIDTKGRGEEDCKEIQRLPEPRDIKISSTQNSGHKLTNDTIKAKKSLKKHSDVHSNTLTGDMTSRPMASKIEKTNKPEHKSRKSKYVINYDDKNGTVSSICKIKPGLGSSQKKIVNYNNKENFKDSTEQKDLNKNVLLQLPEHQSGYSKMKSKIHARKSCQIL